MLRYIDAEKLKAHYAWWNNEDKKVFDYIVDLQPTAIVTCANCKYCESRNNEEPYCHHHAMVVSPDYFCADGEEGEWMP